MRSRASSTGSPSRSRTSTSRSTAQQLHVQPDQLQPTGDHRHDRRDEGASHARVRAVPGHELRDPEIPAHSHRHDNGAGQQSQRREPAFKSPTRRAPRAKTWFKEAKFDLPKQLPARLTTLQQACLAATFEANPAACPHAALIGHATVHTQVLPVPLEGPVYFVYYGGAKFPEAVLVLQGYGITVDLHGETFIDNATGVTSATFRNTPDVPFQSIEVNIPEGPYSEFGANLPPKNNYNFCGQTLTMPTHFQAQNNNEINQNTPITITGCKNIKTPKETRAQKLTKALHACKKDEKQGKRVACEHAARNKYRTKASKNAKGI